MAIDQNKHPAADLSEGDSNLSVHRRGWAARAIDAETISWLQRDAEVFVHQTLSTPCLKRGLSFKTSQGNFIPLSPPLTITRDDLDRAFLIIDDALMNIGSKLT